MTPRAPITSFDPTLPEDAHLVLAAAIPLAAQYSGCEMALHMPMTINAENVVVIHQSDRVDVSGHQRAQRHTKAKNTKAKKRSKAHKKGKTP